MPSQPLKAEAEEEPKEKQQEGISRGLLIVCLVVATQIVAMMTLRQITPLYLESLQAPPAVLGFAVSAYALVPLLIAMPGGLMVDKVGYRKVVQVGALLTVASSLIMVILPPVSLVIVSQLLGGFASILVILATQAYVSNLSPARRTRNFAIYSFSFGVGFLITPPLAGAIRDAWGFAVCFATAAVVGALVWVISTQMQQVAPDPEEKSVQLPEAIRQCRTLLEKPLVKLALGISICVLSIITLRTSFYILYLENVGFTTTSIGVLVAVQEGVALLFRPFLPQLAALLGPLPLIALSLTIGGVGIAATPYFTQFIPLLIAAMLHGITPAFSQPVSMVMMSNSAPSDAQGMAMGFRQMANQAPLFVGPIIFGAVVTYFGLKGAFLLAAGVLLAGAAALMYLHFTMDQKIVNI